MSDANRRISPLARVLFLLRFLPLYAAMSLADWLAPRLPRRWPRRRRERTYAQGISVIVPERGTPSTLAITLDALAAACAKVSEPIQVIVVANGANPAAYAKLRERHTDNASLADALGLRFRRQLLACVAGEHLRHAQDRADVQHVAQAEALLQLAELADVRAEAHFIDGCSILGGRVALEPGGEGHVPARHAAAERLTHVSLPAAQHARQLDRRIEEAVVHRAHFHARVTTAHLAVGCAEPRHAPYHIEPRKLRQINDIVKCGCQFQKSQRTP